VNLQPGSVVVDEAEFSEPVHEEADPRARCADHLSKGLLANFWDHRIGHTVLTEMRQQQKNPSESLFAGIEELVD